MFIPALVVRFTTKDVAYWLAPEERSHSLETQIMLRLMYVVFLTFGVPFFVRFQEAPFQQTDRGGKLKLSRCALAVEYNCFFIIYTSFSYYLSSM
jgi:hypothetical protein